MTGAKVYLGDFDGEIKVYDIWVAFIWRSATTGNSMIVPKPEISKLHVNKFKCFISTSWDRSISIHDENDAEGGVLLRRIDNAHDTEISALDYNRYVLIIYSIKACNL